MGDENNNLPVVENTPAVSATEETPQASTPVAQPLTDARFTEMLGSFEKRISQSVKDTATAAVNKALKEQSAPKPATPVTPVSTTPVTTEPSTPVEPVTEAVPELTDPVMIKAAELLKVDGEDFTKVSPDVLEVYRIQAEAGIHLTPDMPEFAMIDNRSLYSYVVSTKQAVDTAKERMIAEGTYQGDDTPPTMAVASNVLSGSKSVTLPHEGLSGIDTLDMYFKKGR